MLSMEMDLPKGLHEFINDMKQIYTMEIVYTECKPRFYHEYALARLRNEGFKMVVCSNSIRKTIEVMLQKAAILQYFDFFLSNQDVKNGKPDPEIYNKAITQLGLTPTECLILEDNENGLRAARASKAWVMEIEKVEDVNYQNIKLHLQMFEETLK